MTLTTGRGIFSAIAAIAAICGIVLAWYLFVISCDNRIIAVIPSPDGWYKAVVFSRDCGVTAGSSTHVSVMWAWSQLEGAGNIFVADTGHGKVSGGPVSGPDVRVSWQSPRDLVVSYEPSARVIRFEEKLSGITVHYLPVPASTAGVAP